MNKSFKKLMSVLLALMLVLSIAACGGNGDGGGATIQPSDGPSLAWTNDDTAEITIMMSGDATPNEDNMVLQALEKATNTKIKMIYISSGDYDAKLNAMIGAETLPDIFWISANDAASLKEAGLLANMKDVFDAVAPNVLEETKEILPNVALNNDGIYLVPNAKRGYATNVNIRTDWLNNLGLEMPTDLDSFAKVMHAFTYDDPDGNGKDDTFGYSFNLDSLSTGSGCGANIFGAYGIAKGRAMVMEDGTVTSWVKHPRFLEAMKYLKALIDDGVCEPDFVTIPNLSMFEKLWIGTSGCMEWECVGPTNNWMPGRYTEDPLPTFGFAILEGPYGDAGSGAVYPITTTGWVFSAGCKNLEGAARIANYLMTEEGSDLLYFGVEGVMYNWVDREEGIVQHIGEYADDATNRANGAYCYTNLFTPYSSAEVRTLNAQTQAGVQLAHDYPIAWANISAVSEVYNQHGADMNQLVKEMIAELLTTDTDKMDSVYQEYIKEWESIGGTEWEAEVTQLWNEQNGK